MVRHLRAGIEFARDDLRGGVVGGAAGGAEELTVLGAGVREGLSLSMAELAATDWLDR